MEKHVSRIERVIPQGESSQVRDKQLVIGAEGREKTTPFLFLSEDWFSAPKGFETRAAPGRRRYRRTETCAGSAANLASTAIKGSRS